MIQAQLPLPRLETMPCRPLPLAAPDARNIVEQAVAAVFGVPLRELRASTRRQASTAFARQVAMYLAHVTCGLNLTEVGSLFGRDRTTVGHACGVVEDRRDDPSFDRLMDHLERAVMRLLAAFVYMDAPHR
jgi:chromosomal replication initiation ATPase DnaA